tara:strand:+ start:723 stop:1163 length:441 start_codon:yes stop_codon:yes gene_type:complete
MRKEFVMRGQTASGQTEVLNFGKYKQGYAYRMTEFAIYPSTGISSANWEITGTVTAGKTAVTPTDPNFNDDGLIATSMSQDYNSSLGPISNMTIVNDTYIITQNLILMVQNTENTPINWQCRFESVKMTGPEEAAVNYKQFAISDE